MTSIARPRSRPLPARAAPGAITRIEAIMLGAILVAALGARLLAVRVLSEPIVSDAAAYLMMAKTAIGGPVMVDIYGNKALYSPGYPLLISLAFRVFGAAPDVVRGLNVALGMAGVLLTWALARAATGRPPVALIAAAAMAVLIPAVAGTALFERENLSTPLLLLYLLLAVAMIDARRPLPLALAAGLAFGCGLLAGVSTLFTGAAFLGAVALRGPGWGRGAGLVLVFAVAAALVLAPWLARNDRVLGRPVMSTNSGINLYVGNNPAATGYFVSIAETPIAHDWKAMRVRYGEIGLSDVLGRMAIDYALAHKAHTVWLDLHKLVYFWLPDTPDASDSQLGTAVTAIRWLGALQHLLILALALVGIAGSRRWSAGLWLLLLAICAFWSIHGLVYMITRYRAPAMPLMLVLAALPVADLATRRAARQAPAPLVRGT